MVNIFRLNKYFNKGKQNELHVINDVSLTLPDTGMTAIFGKSGCGKTTLLNVIGGLDGFSSGTVSVNGCDIKNDTDYLRNKSIGYIFQNYNLNLTKNVFDNVADILRLCGEKDRTFIENRVMYALKSVGMENFKNRLPDSLSGGQQQRVAIARAIVKSPSIILADEPTGNLDEHNTVMVMDMLKAISKTCLVVLVTHEANLVDYYCDFVIEVSDGKIVNTRANENANGFTGIKSNEIHLGDLEKNELFENNLSLECYGEKPDAPVKIRFISSGGKMYLKVESNEVTVLDDKSEIKILEGKSVGTQEKSEQMVYQPLLPLEEKNPSKYGRLFTFRESLGKGFGGIVMNRKKGRKFMRSCMIIFGAVLVLFSAIYSKKTADIFDVKDSISPNSFFVSAKTEDITEKLGKAVSDPESGIYGFSAYGPAFYTYFGGAEECTSSIEFNPNFFSSARIYNYLESDVTFTDFGFAGNSKIIAGEKKTGDGYIWLSKKAADLLISASKVPYITGYSDLIWLKTLRGQTVSAVVDLDGVYACMSENELAKQILSSSFRNLYGFVTDSGTVPEKGTVVLRDFDGVYANETAGDKFTVCGMEFTVSDIITIFKSYESWLQEYYPDEYEAYTALLDMNEEKIGRITENIFNSPETAERLGIRPGESENRLAVTLFAYGRTDEWCEYCEKNSIVFDDMMFYAYKNGYESAKYPAFCEYTENFAFYWYVRTYAEKYGSLPSDKEEYLIYEKIWDYSDECSMEYLRDKIYREFDKYNDYGYYDTPSDLVILNPEDYIALSKSCGRSEGKIIEYNYYLGDYEEEYLIVFSENPQKTEEYLRLIVGDEAKNTKVYDKKLITPDDIFEFRLQKKQLNATGGIITFAIVLTLLCLAVYFIIRSTLLNRVREIGIYRAIGVKKSNIRFEFFVETMTLTVTSVYIGFAGMSAILFYLIKESTTAASTLFYPWWFAVIMLGFITAVCAFFGLLPINTLIRKTPAQILAKYDI